MGLTVGELKSTARKIGIKNYENEIMKIMKIDKLEPSKESKKKKITSSLLLKGKKALDLNFKKKQEKVLRLSIKK